MMTLELSRTGWLCVGHMPKYEAWPELVSPRWGGRVDGGANPFMLQEDPGQGVRVGGVPRKELVNTISQSRQKIC